MCILSTMLLTGGRDVAALTLHRGGLCPKLLPVVLIAEGSQGRDSSFLKQQGMSTARHTAAQSPDTLPASSAATPSPDVRLGGQPLQAAWLHFPQ